DETRYMADSVVFEGILWRRVGAYMIDATLILAINIAAHLVLLILGLVTFGLAWLLLWPVMFPTVALAYGTLFIGGGRGAAPRVRLFGLQAPGLRGAPPGHFQAFFMTALFYATPPTAGFLVLLVPLFPQSKPPAH